MFNLVQYTTENNMTTVYTWSDGRSVKSIISTIRNVVDNLDDLIAINTELLEDHNIDTVYIPSV